MNLYGKICTYVNLNVKKKNWERERGYLFKLSIEDDLEVCM